MNKAQRRQRRRETNDLLRLAATVALVMIAFDVQAIAKELRRRRPGPPVPPSTSAVRS